MRVEYGDGYVRKICTDERFARQDFPPQIVSEIYYLLSAIDSFVKTLDVFFFNSALFKKYSPEYLNGKERGIIAMRLNKTYRIKFEKVISNNGEELAKVLEICNHKYK